MIKYNIGLKKLKDAFNMVQSDIESRDNRIEYLENLEKTSIRIQLDDLDKCKNDKDRSDLITRERIKQGVIVWKNK